MKRRDEPMRKRWLPGLVLTGMLIFGLAALHNFLPLGTQSQLLSAGMLPLLNLSDAIKRRHQSFAESQPRAPLRIREIHLLEPFTRLWR